MSRQAHTAQKVRSSAQIAAFADAGVVALAEHCKELRSIDLMHCNKVTDAGVRTFKERLPECTVYGKW